MFLFTDQLYKLIGKERGGDRTGDGRSRTGRSRSGTPTRTMAERRNRRPVADDWDPHSTALDPGSLGAVDLADKAEELGIKYFLVSYAPLNADTRVSVIPKRAIAGVQRSGCGIPAAMYFKSDGADPEMYLRPDSRTLIQLPWKPEYAWLSSNLYMGGEPFKQCPRRALIRQCERARDMGYVMKAGIEPEFILLDKEGRQLGDPIDARQPMCLQEPLATLRTSALMTRISDTMEELGWEPYEIDHEATCCQYEINFGYVDSLSLADRQSFMKFMIKELAELEGYRVTFMPIPLSNLLCANGLHINISLWNVSDGKNAFKDPSDSELGFSKTAYHFLAGLKAHARSSCALLCPTVNSYKRLNAGSWCPNTVSWGGNNRTVLLRVPANNRIEHRLADGSCNPYLAQAAILTAGLDGIERKLDPGTRCDTLITEFPEKVERMPRNLLDAVRTLEADKYMCDSLGPELVEGFSYLKNKEWDSYTSHLSQWEKDYYFNC